MNYDKLKKLIASNESLRTQTNLLYQVLGACSTIDSDTKNYIYGEIDAMNKDIERNTKSIASILGK